MDQPKSDVPAAANSERRARVDPSSDCESRSPWAGRLRRLVALQHTSIDVYAYAGCRIKIASCTACCDPDRPSERRHEVGLDQRVTCAPDTTSDSRFSGPARPLEGNRRKPRPCAFPAFFCSAHCLVFGHTLRPGGRYSPPDEHKTRRTQDKRRDSLRGRDGMLEESEGQQLRDRP